MQAAINMVATRAGQVKPRLQVEFEKAGVCQNPLSKTK
jgi:hypothetical protein